MPRRKMAANSILESGFYALKCSKDGFFKAGNVQLKKDSNFQFKTVNFQSKEQKMRRCVQQDNHDGLEPGNEIETVLLVLNP